MTWTAVGTMESKRTEQRGGGRGGGGGLPSASQLVDPYPPGQAVRVQVVPGEEREGEVICWDPASKVILIRALVPGEPFKTQLHVLNMAHINSIEPLQDAPPPATPPQLPNSDFQKLKKKLDRELQKRERSFITTDVSPTGHKLFFAIQKTLEDVRWDEERLIVFSEVEVRPPYTPDDVRALSPNTRAASTAEHVRKIVRRSLGKMEAAEEGISGEDPAILAASLSALPPLPPEEEGEDGAVVEEEEEDALAEDDAAAFVDAPEDLPRPEPVSA